MKGKQAFGMNKEGIVVPDNGMDGDGVSGQGGNGGAVEDGCGGGVDGVLARSGSRGPTSGPSVLSSAYPSRTPTEVGGTGGWTGAGAGPGDRTGDKSVMVVEDLVGMAHPWGDEGDDDDVEGGKRGDAKVKTTDM